MVLAVLAAAVLLSRRVPQDAGPPASEWSPWVVLSGTLAVAFALYWPALHIGFLSDDFVLADRATRGELVAPSHEFVRPVPLLVWRLVFMTGAGAVVLHGLNIALHGVNAALTVRLARHMGGTHAAALLAALLFLIWPTQVESVAWASGVFDVMMTTLVLATINLSLSPVPDLRAPRIAAIVLLAMLALLTKETAAAIPALLIVSSSARWMSRRPSRAELTALAGVTLTCAAYMFWRVVLRPAVAGSPRPVLTRYAVKELLSRTYGALAVPFTTEWIANTPLVPIAFAFAVVLFGILPIVAGRRDGLKGSAVAGSIWPALAGAPALGYLFVSGNLEGSRYVYLPMVGWAVFLAVTAAAAAALWRGMLPVVAVCGIVLLTVAVLHTRAILADWSEAAAHRDRILSAAIRAQALGRCAVAHFTGAPGSYKGAQLFKNGLDEAARAASATLAPDAFDDRRCQFVWDGATFIPR
jgi:protein O-mannosyl-transferase